MDTTRNYPSPHRKHIKQAQKLEPGGWRPGCLASGGPLGCPGPAAWHQYDDGGLEAEMAVPVQVVKAFLKEGLGLQAPEKRKQECFGDSRDI